MSDLDNLLKEGITAVKGGRRSRARALLQEVIRLRPNDVAAWLWLSGAVETDDERRQCLEKVLEIDPGNPYAKRGLQTLPPHTALPKMPTPSSIVADATVCAEPEPVLVGKPEISPVTPQGKAMTRCPHCGATPQRESRFCATCGADLTAQVGTKTSVRLPAVSGNDLLEEEVRQLTKQGWKIINRTETAVQVEKRKRWSQMGFVLLVLLPSLGGCVFPIFWGIAILGLIIVVLDYMVKKNKTKYITAKELEEERQQIEQRKKQMENAIERLAEDIRSLGIPGAAWIIGGIIGAIIVIFLLAIVWDNFNIAPGRHEEPLPTMTYPPTWTPTPRVTATSKPIAAPKLSTDESQYLSQATFECDLLFGTVFSITDLLDEATSDPNLIYDQTWQASLAGEGIILQDVKSALEKLTPPERFTSFHDNATTMMAHFDKVGKLLVEYADTLDNDLMNQAADEMDIAVPITQQVVEQMRQFRRDYDLVYIYVE